ncbi:hypothetical protein BDK51DRAFT_41901 [Blyttiomyces helicus]|uniref:SH3 domain-containing protein n=1 Tax=Blyttiomyces helicus TaxID=388810 RepID=A0A4P9WJ74_9FUNG|nr:hypothetical protein BDK51DRAFT_41901 [Blyttiomyces helicus]|eukprot:RKO90656.1 hypothetical protein BDK51DRAFT_41901 [Blyttiomyces helicus]
MKIKFLAVFAACMSAVAAQGTAGSPQCFSLKGSKTCPDLQQFSVESIAQFSDVGGFDTFISSNYDNMTMYQGMFASTYGCPKWAGGQQRYHISTMCYYVSFLSGGRGRTEEAGAALDSSTGGGFVQTAQCAQPTPPPQLCQSSCNDFLTSMTTVFSNATACEQNPSSAIATARSEDTTDTSRSPYPEFCSMLNNNPTCSKGLSLEVATCGFFQASDAATFCANTTNSALPCCKSMNDAALQKIANGLGPINSLPWIAAGVALGVLVLILLLYVCCMRMDGWKRKATVAVQPPPSAIERGGTIARGDMETIGRPGAGNGPFGRSAPPSGGLMATVRASFLGKPSSSSSRPPMPPMSLAAQGARMGEDDFDRGGVDALPPAIPMPTELRTPKGGYSLYSSPDSVFGNGAYDDAPAVPPLPAMLGAAQAAESGAGNSDGGRYMKVVESYDRQLEDELTLVVGDVVFVEESFDDGWAIGRNEDTNESGAFPMSCLESLAASTNGRTRSIVGERTKSLYSSNGR